jgi:FkbM family methyltransferase
VTILNAIRRAVQRVGLDVQRYPHADPLFQVAHLLRVRDIEYVLDIGANTGQYVQHLRRLGYRRFVVSVEPLSDAAAQLRRNAERDALWVVEQAAVGAQAGEATLNVAGNSVSSSIAAMLDRHVAGAPESVTVRTEQVRVVTVDELVAKHRPPLERTFIKIDVQGFERQVFAGAEQTLAEVAGVQVELGLAPLYDGQIDLDEGVEMMRDLGFVLVTVLPGFTDQRTGETLQCDGVFFRTT